MESTTTDYQPPVAGDHNPESSTRHGNILRVPRNFGMTFDHDAAPPGTLVFGEFSLDLGRATLLHHAAPVSLTPKAFSVLEYLAQHAGRLVTKDEFMDRLWPGVFVGDAALKVCVREIRRALADDSHHPRYVETAHRRGYRFIAPVTVITSPTANAPLVAAAAAPHLSGTATEPALPTTHYARSGDVNIAYQVVGDGPIDLV